MYPLSTAASAFSMDDPAAPITAVGNRVSTCSRELDVVRGEALTVVAQGGKLEIKDAALVLAHAADADGVAVAEIAVQARLRPVLLVKDLDGRVRRRRAAELLGLGRVAAERVLALLRRRGGLALELEAHAGRVARP